RPNTAGLGLERAGVHVTEEGAIKVNVPRSCAHLPIFARSFSHSLYYPSVFLLFLSLNDSVYFQNYIPDYFGGPTSHLSILLATRLLTPHPSHSSSLLLPSLVLPTLPFSSPSHSPLLHPNVLDE